MTKLGSTLILCGDSKLIVQQVKDVYQVKQPLLKLYRNEVWDLIDNFFLAFNITYIPRYHNKKTNSLDLAAIYFKVPKIPHLKYPIEVRYKSPILDNIKNWKSFMMIKRFRNF